MKINSIKLSVTFWFAWKWFPWFAYLKDSTLMWHNISGKNMVTNEDNWTEKASHIEIHWLFFKLEIEWSIKK